MGRLGILGFGCLALGGLVSCSKTDPGPARDPNMVASGGASSVTGGTSGTGGATGSTGGASGTGGQLGPRFDSGMQVSTPDAGATDGGTVICEQDNAEADLSLRPIDIIIPIDTSGSMDEEIAGVQSNINNSFAQIMGASGIDFRIVLISDSDVCIQGALNPAGCGQSSPPAFTWVDQGVGSHDAWCRVLETYPLWTQVLRPEAFKVFVAVTDDDPDCNGMGANAAGAAAFDAALLASDPAQFGTSSARNYVWHSLVALAVNTPATAPYSPTDPIVLGECPGSSGAGQGYQHLSQVTEGLRFPVCEGNNFDAVFQEIAQGIVDGAAVVCEFAIPLTGEGGKEIDRSTIEVAYVPGDRSATSKFARVDGVADCANGAFYLEGDSVKLCPTACDAVKLDHDAEIQVLFGCDVCSGLDVECGTAPPKDLPPLD